MNEIIKEEDINNMIYTIRGVQVILDSDLARIYQVETKRINEAVKNNPRKFSLKHCFILTNDEKNNLWSKFSTANISKMSRSNPRVFTEQGVYMISTILKSNVAVEVTLNIIDAFVAMKHFYIENKSTVANRILLLEDQVDKNTKNINTLLSKFDNNDIKKQYTFYKGSYYDTYSFFLRVLFKGVKEIIIIDNYAGRELLDIIKDVDKRIIIISKNINDTLKDKYEEQYHNVTFIYNNTIHDRYIILDRCRLFHSGMSFKDLGKSTFTITEFDNKEEIDDFINKLELNK